jgi:hypothetical protein
MAPLPLTNPFRRVTFRYYEDKAYDFSHHKNKPIIPRQQGGASQ